MTKNPKRRSGLVLWIMGPTSSGKTTIAESLVRLLRENGEWVLHFDGDEIRAFFGTNLGFAPDDRLRVVSTLSHLANKARDAGALVIVSALTANEDARQYIRENISNLHILYLDCPIEVCADRDPKQLYAKAKRGEISTLIGVNTPYVRPTRAELTIDTSCSSLVDSVDIAMRYLESLDAKIDR